MDDRDFPMDGNAAQIRAISEQLAANIMQQVRDGAMPRTQNDPEFQEWLDRRITEKIRLWIGGILFVQLVPIIAIAFTLGSISENISDTLGNVEAQQDTLSARGRWMQEQEDFKSDISGWAGRDPKRPYVPRSPRNNYGATQGGE